MDGQANQPRVLIIVNVFHPDRGGGAAVFTDLARGLAERGFAVTVRCAYPYYPEWCDKSGKNGWRIQRYEEEGVKVERYGIFIPSRPNRLFQRLVYESSFFFSLLRSLPRGRAYDMAMVFCPLVGAVAFATINKWVWRRPLWLNVQDLSATAAKAGGIARGRLVPAVLNAVQKGLFNRADVWSSISPVMIDRLLPLRTGKQPVLYLPNWLNASLAAEIRALPDRTRRPPADPVNLLYAGNIGTKQDLLRFCQALHASAARFMFRIHGDGGHAESVREWVEHTGDTRFSFGPFLDEAAFAAALHATDFFVITERSGSGGSFIPSKMIPGMAAGCPILAVCDADSPLGREMHNEEPGPCFAWERLGEVPEFLNGVAAQPERFFAWRQNAVRRGAHHDRDLVVDRFAEAIRAIASAKGVDASVLQDGTVR